MNPYPDGVPSAYLDPGGLIVSESPMIVTTVLGSCVSVTLFNARLKVGAICHGLLPQCREAHHCTGRCMEHHRYVECAIFRMLQSFRQLGIANEEIEAKIFGGSDMFSVAAAAQTGLSVGRQNIASAKKMLAEQQIRISKSDVGGQQGRKIVFQTHTGDVFLKRLNKSEGIDCGP